MSSMASYSASKSNKDKRTRTGYEPVYLADKIRGLLSSKTPNPFKKLKTQSSKKRSIHETDSVTDTDTDR